MKKSDLHSKLTDRAALLLLDFINPFDFPNADNLLTNAASIVDEVRSTALAFRAAEAPVIFVNDNFGRWRSNFHELVEICEGGRSGAIIEALHPTQDDYFVLKPHRSGFYRTPLELLLEELKCDKVVLAGITTDMCILATANDACMRDLETVILTDGTATFDADRHNDALRLMERSLQASLCSCEQARQYIEGGPNND